MTLTDAFTCYILCKFQVVCNGHFGDNKLPLDQLRKDVEILRIVPTSTKCAQVGVHGETHCTLVENRLTLGPIYKVIFT